MMGYTLYLSDYSFRKNVFVVTVSVGGPVNLCD